jgi:hypothetical protein
MTDKKELNKENEYWILFLSLGGICSVFLIIGYFFANEKISEDKKNINSDHPTPSFVPSPTSSSKKTLDGYYAAISEESLNMMVDAAVKKDIGALAEIESKGLIFPVYPNQEVFIVGCHGFICSTVSFRYKGKTQILWTVKEAID